MESKISNDYFVASNNEELLYGLSNKEPYIKINENFKKDFTEKTQLPLSETEQIGFNLGFRGFGGIIGEVFFKLINLFSEGNKQQKRVDSQIRKYSLEKSEDNELLLHLRQLDY